MILELVTFRNRPGLTRAEEIAGARASAHHWLANTELVAKHFLRDDEGNGAGVYIWPSIEAAQRAHNDEWRAGVIARTGGNAPTIRYFELMCTTDGVTKKVIDYETERAPA